MWLDENWMVMIDEGGRLVDYDWLRVHRSLLADDGLGNVCRSWRDCNRLRHEIELSLNYPIRSNSLLRG